MRGHWRSGSAGVLALVVLLTGCEGTGSQGAQQNNEDLYQYPCEENPKCEEVAPWEPGMILGEEAYDAAVSEQDAMVAGGVDADDYHGAVAQTIDCLESNAAYDAWLEFNPRDINRPQLQTQVHGITEMDSEELDELTHVEQECESAFLNMAQSEYWSNFDEAEFDGDLILMTIECLEREGLQPDGDEQNAEQLKNSVDDDRFVVDGCVTMSEEELYPEPERILD